MKKFRDKYLEPRRLDGAPLHAMQLDSAQNNETFDIIILGAGSAGSIVAANLAASSPALKIALVDAGYEVSPTNQTVWDPTQWVLVSDDKELEWGYQSTPQFGLDNRAIAMGRARGMGGCALHNGMVYVRGGSKGYNNWAQNLNCSDWAYNANVPYFERVESRVHITIAQHDPFIEALIQAANNNGLTYNENYNKTLNEACIAPFQFAISPEGKRETTYSTYQPSSYLNVKVFEGWMVERLILSGYTVQGVTLGRGRRQQIDLWANCEVILSAGAIGSPQILMLSGIGPADDLEKLGIEVALDVSAVGEDLQDDLFVTAAWKSKQPMPPQPYGLMGVAIFANSSNNNWMTLGTDIECSLAAGTMAGMGLPSNQQQSYWIYPNLQLLKSRGTVKLVSSNPYDAPLIDPNYLSDPDDMQNCIDGLNLALAIGSDAAMADWMGDEILPGDRSGDIETYIRQTAGTCYHYAGTCRMGDDSAAVTTQDLRVRGIERLRVIDASVIPQLVSGNSAAATMMIAARGSQFVLDSL